jgi:Tol biopolymer transport system component
MNRRHFFSTLAGAGAATIVAAQTNPAATPPVQLAWYDRTGKEIEKVGKPAPYRGLDLSPDGMRIAVHRHEMKGGDIWILEGGRETQLTRDVDGTQDNASPIWSPDGSRILFGSYRKGKWGLYMKLADGTGAEELLLEGEGAKMPMDWSRDGKFITYWAGANEQFAVPLASDRKALQFLQTPFTGAHPQVSIDGKWLLYASPEAGGNQIFIKSFPSGNGKWQISTANGVFPRWRTDGREVFFLGAANNGAMMSAEINVKGSGLEPAAPKALFDSGYVNTAHPGGNYHTFAVSPDGQKFLIPRPL